MRTRRWLAALAWMAIAIAGSLTPSRAAEQQAPLTACNAQAISAAIAAGGLVDIDCAATTVFTFSSEQVINSTTIIDGHSRVVFDGQNTRRLLRSADNVSLTLRNLTIRNGRTNGQGGGLLAGDGNTLTISNVRFENNRSTRDTAACAGGGAIFLGSGGKAVISDSTFVNNRANNGGAINSLRSSLSITGSTFSGNQAIHTDAINQHGDCGGGGAIFINGTRLPAGGGPDTLILRDNVYTDNTTNNHGGAIFAALNSNEILMIDRSTFEDNSATKSASMPPSGTGGAIWFSFASWSTENERLILTNSTLANNTAVSQGGGLWTQAPVTIANATFVGNDANNPAAPIDNEQRGSGGALAVAVDAPIDINNATFAHNHAGFNGGAIFGRTISLKNTLFYNNTTDWSSNIQQHCTNALIDLGNNMQYPPRNPEDHWNETNCTTGIDTSNPALAALADNGGPTETMALPAGSPALNRGNPLTCVGLDQRGYTRSGICDVGAYERGGTAFAPTQFARHALILR